MYKNNKICCLIPARKGSVGYKNKNFKKINSKPLIYYPIKTSLKSKLIDKIFFTSDSIAYLNFVKKFKRVVRLKRPKKYSSNNSKIYDTINYYIQKFELKKKFDVIVLLEPTSPLTQSNDLDLGIKKLIDKKYTSLISASEYSVPNKHYELIIKNGFIKLKNSQNKSITNRQSLKKKYYQTGSFYISKVDSLYNNKSFYQNKTGFYLLDKKNIFEIDDKIDFSIVKNLIENSIV